MFSRICTATLLVLTASLNFRECAIAANSEYDGYHTMAVISLLGDDVEMKTEGVTRFGYHDYKLHTGWNLDAEIADAIANTLKERFLVKENAIEKAVFPAITADFLHDPATQVQRVLASLPQTNDLDAYIVVFPQEGGMGGNPGLVVIRAQGLFGSGTTSIETNYEVAVYDARTRRRMDFATARFNGDIASPVEFCSNSVWADSADALTDEQKLRVKREVESLIARSLVYTLASAGLIGHADSAVAAAKNQTSGDPSCHGP